MMNIISGIASLFFGDQEDMLCDDDEYYFGIKNFGILWVIIWIIRVKYKKSK